jgi:hypothetical protein
VVYSTATNYVCLQARQLALRLCKKGSVEFTASPRFLQGFFDRHPEIGKRTLNKMEERRTTALTTNKAREHLNSFARFCEEHKITRAWQIMNMDQSGVRVGFLCVLWRDSSVYGGVVCRSTKVARRHPWVWAAGRALHLW